MFGSISIADPNTTVTSSFTATENCRIGVEEGYPVRVNGQTTSSRLIDLVSGQKIEMDVVSAAANQHKFVPWSYNGVPSYFAVVSNAGSAKPTLRSMYRGRTWLDFAPTDAHLFGYENSSKSESVLSKNGTTSGTQTTDLAVVIEPAARIIHFYRGTDGARVYTLSTDAMPLAHTTLWNGAANAWESVALDAQGYLYRWTSGHSRTKSTATFAGARTVFSDGTTLYVAGDRFVSILSDLNTVARTYTTDEQVQYGVAIADMAIVTTASGKAFKLGAAQLDLLFQESMIGVPAVFQNLFVFPITEKYKLSVYNHQAIPVGDLDTGDILPWAVSTWRDARMAVAGADSPRVLLYADVVTAPEVRTFDYNVTFAVPVSDSIITSYYLKSFQLTIPPNPVVTGPAFRDWKAPIDVLAGSGEYTVHTVGEKLTCFASPNATLYVDGSTTDNLASEGTRIQLSQRAYEGQARASAVVGNYAFDFKTRASQSSSIATFINTGTKTKASQLVWSFKVPKRVVNAPIALSVGTLQVDGNVYDGVTPVNAGQILTITINVPTTATYYIGLLSIADAQYPLIMNVATNRDADVRKFQPYGATDVTSTFKVDEDGLYDFPPYKGAYVMKGEELLTFPVQLAKDDELTVRHIQASSWWLDERDTVIVGPSINYYAKSFTTVDDMPENVNFGTVHRGIPDFDFEGDLEPVIEGLSEDYEITIYADYLQFSVNGGPYVARPTVKNGDKVKALYNVRNLFDQQATKTLLADEVTVYEFGYLNIDPALGQWVPERSTLEMGGTFQWDYQWNHIELPDANTSEYQQLGDRYMDANTPEVQVMPDKYMEANTPQYQQERAPTGVASVGRWFQGSNPPGKASVGQWQDSSAQRGTRLNSGSFSRETTAYSLLSTPMFVPVNQLDTPTSKGFIPVRANIAYDRQTYRYQAQFSSIRLADGIQLTYEPSFGVQATYARFTPTFHHESSLSPRYVNPAYLYQATKNDRIANTYWTMIQMGRLRYYGPGWRQLEGPVFRQHKRTWVDFTSKNYARYLPGYDSMSYVIRYADLNAVWQQGVLIRLKQNEASWFQGSNIRVKKIDAFVSQATLVQYSNKPVLFTPSFAQVDIKGKAVKAASLATVNMPKVKETNFTEVSYRPASFVPFEPQWETFLPLQTGGFATAELAKTAAEAYNNVLPLTVYQQPEGSFSYVFKRNTELVCQIKGTNIFAVKWLIGGG